MKQSETLEPPIQNLNEPAGTTTPIVDQTATYHRFPSIQTKAAAPCYDQEFGFTYKYLS